MGLEVGDLGFFALGLCGDRVIVFGFELWDLDWYLGWGLDGVWMWMSGGSKHFACLGNCTILSYKMG